MTKRKHYSRKPKRRRRIGGGECDKEKKKYNDIKKFWEKHGIGGTGASKISIYKRKLDECLEKKRKHKSPTSTTASSVRGFLVRS